MLVNVTYLREEVRAGTGAQVKPTQPQRQGFSCSSRPPSLPACLPPQEFRASQSPHSGRSSKLRQSHVGVIFPLFRVSRRKITGPGRKRSKGKEVGESGKVSI